MDDDDDDDDDQVVDDEELDEGKQLILFSKTKF